MTNGDDQAFPTSGITRVGEVIKTDIRLGMTKREFFAAMAMQGLVGHSGIFLDLQGMTDACVKSVDALIASLNEAEKKT